MSLEVKVGLMFLIGLIGTLWFTIYVGDFSLEQGQYTVRFRNVQGLGGGSNIHYNGVRVGRVRRVEPGIDATGRSEVRVHFDIEPQFREAVLINDDTRYAISQGMLGASTLVIISSGAGQVIRQELLDRMGDEPVTMSDVMQQINDLIAENRANLKQTIDALPKAAERFTAMSEEIRVMVAENRQRISDAIDQLGGMGRSIREVIAENREALGQAVTRFRDMASQIEELVKENRPDLRRAVAGLPDTVTRIEGAAGQIEDMVRENRPQIKLTIDHLAELSPRLNEIGLDIRAITDQIASGRGTIGRLVMEDTMHDKATEAIDSFGQRMEEIQPLTAGISQLKFYIGLRGGMNTDTEALTGTAYLRIEPKPWKFYEAGVGYRTAPHGRDTKDEDPDDFNIDFNLMFGWRFFPDDEQQLYRLTVKGGLIEGTFGGQIDVPLWRDRLTLQTMIRNRHTRFDPDDRRHEEGSGPMIRATVSCRLWRRVGVYVGADDLVDSPAVFVGLSAEMLDNDIRNLVTAAGILP